MKRTLVVVGYGMTAHRLIEHLRADDQSARWRVVVASEEPRPAYDRVALSSYLAGRTAEELTLAGPELLDDPRIDLRLSSPVVSLDRGARTVGFADGSAVRYDALVLATGSRPFVPPVPGHELPGAFTYRTIADLDALREASVPGAAGVVIGGGLLGLEAAQALRSLGMTPHVVELSPHLMPLQIDEGGGAVLARLVGGLGMRVHCGVSVASVDAGPDGRVCGVALSDGSFLEARSVVFSAGVRPRDELAGPAGLERGERGGFLVDAYCRTGDERIWAIGECAAVEGRCHGLVAPGYLMAESVARQLLADRPAAPFPGADASAKLKVFGVEVAGFGDVHARTEGALSFVREDLAAATYAKLVLSSDGRTLLGGVLAGDAHAYGELRAMLGHELTGPPELLLA
ncbi:FAD-dependent oxidoreductase [Streptomyces sp. NBC_00249]|uniref:NAD(P)/FAD-dependent oxidoreductase n=1 Tax=Streptomyces sp. NBC_00249 TaxID=2975690 RepID=UPI002250EB81|nr:FAD-dependent oxidoreductase [Streptomyces sp. NBC_00249]MCX5197285.1 FAD-dependent oxidoreductase [Streptomyces sp. NBC_00249]